MNGSKMRRKVNTHNRGVKMVFLKLLPVQMQERNMGGIYYSVIQIIDLFLKKTLSKAAGGMIFVNRSLLFTWGLSKCPGLCLNSTRIPLFLTPVRWERMLRHNMSNISILTSQQQLLLFIMHLASVATCQSNKYHSTESPK